MSEEAAFLDQIKAVPYDETVRLVYADWLEERSDPRAKYLRLDIELGQRLAEKQTLAREMLDQHLESQDGIDLNWLILVTRATSSAPPHLYTWFWRILKSSNRTLRALCRQLESLSEESLRSYAYQVEEAKDYVNPCVWDECQPHLRRGCSEDHGDDFAAWVVMEGREFYEVVRSHPEQIDQHLEMYDEAVRQRHQKRKRRNGPKLWNDEVDRPEYEGYQRADGLAYPVYEVRFGRELCL